MNEQSIEELEKNKIETEFNGYSLFTEVEDITLQAFNRCVAMFNIMSIHSAMAAEEYAKQIDEKGRSIMFAMFVYIRNRGLEEVQAEMSRGELKLYTAEEAAIEQAVEESKDAPIN